ncbi:uncharacterized protein [Spinacia oleracea]|uniref:Uncharacterized protein n=1 Tax=Spinacia oleracea TaxID=3562 RepID=A0ABM3RJ98_SPIOL|nr:uncharacterized protein LOC130470123 [Spinacia oleracea]
MTDELRSRSLHQDVVRSSHLENVVGNSHATGENIEDSGAEENIEEGEGSGDSILEYGEDELEELWYDGEDVAAICEQVMREGALDVEPDFEDDDEEHKIPCPSDATSEIATTKILTVCRNKVVKDDHPRWVKEYLTLPGGYRLVVPGDGSVIGDCPNDHTAVYVHHYDYGLLFPLHPYLAKILRACNFCLAQIIPPSSAHCSSMDYELLDREVLLLALTTSC